MPDGLMELAQRVASLEARLSDDREADKGTRQERQERLDEELSTIEGKIDSQNTELKDKIDKLFLQVFGNGRVEGSICWRLKKLEDWVGSYDGRSDKVWGMVRALVTAVGSSLLTFILIKTLT